MIQNTGGNVFFSKSVLNFYKIYNKKRMLKMEWKMPKVEFNPYLKDLASI